MTRKVVFNPFFFFFDKNPTNKQPPMPRIKKQQMIKLKIKFNAFYTDLDDDTQNSELPF